MKRIALVTGANSGIGLETALGLATKGFHVVMLCRNPVRGQAALAQVQAAHGENSARLMLCDLADMEDIRRFCQAFRQEIHGLDLLVNNAGVLCFDRQETKDDLEMHFGVCHIGHFLLNQLLLDHLNPGARIVVVGSVAHKVGRLDFEDLNLRQDYSIARAYAQAKLCNLLYTQEMARRLQGTEISVHCVHPGAVVTNIGAKRGQGVKPLSPLRRHAGKLLGIIVKTPAQGAACTLYAATSPGLVNGGYYARCKPAKPGKRALDPSLAARLWQTSLEITGLDQSPK